MSNQQAIDIIEKMIDDFNETERRGLYLSDNETYARDVLIETKYKIQSRPDTDDEWISADNPPDHIGKVLVIANGIIDIASYDEYEEGWNYNDEITDDGVVTFWQELPALPTPPITK